MSSALERAQRLLSSDTATIRSYGKAPAHERPVFLETIRSALNENPLGRAAKRVFFAGMASLMLTSALSQTVHAMQSVEPDNSPTALHSPHIGPDPFKTGIDTDSLFSTATRGPLEGKLKAIAGEFNLELIHGDVNDIDSMQSFADTLADKGVKTGADIANALINDGNGQSPVVMQFFSGVDADGTQHNLAAITYDSTQNPIFKRVFGDFERTFHTTAEANHAVETATGLHEMMHAIVKSGEQNGLQAWKDALKGDFSKFETWSNSVDAQVSHPQVKQVLTDEVHKLQQIYATGAGSYDAGQVVEKIRSIQATDEYANFQENMADGLMSVKFLQDGHSISQGVGDSRHAEAHRDPVHDTSAGQQWITDHLTTEDLQGKSFTELVSTTAQAVKSGMHLSDANFTPLDDGLDNTAERMVADGHQDSPLKGGMDRTVDLGAMYAVGSGIADPKPTHIHVTATVTGMKDLLTGTNLALTQAAACLAANGVSLAPAGKMLREAAPTTGNYHGKVVAIDHSAGLVFQSLGRGQSAVHHMNDFSKVPDVGQVTSISYSHGRAQVNAPDLGLGQSQSRGGHSR